MQPAAYSLSNASPTVGFAPQPDDAVPRFDYEGNLRALIAERHWPESTRRIAELTVAVLLAASGSTPYRRNAA